MTEEHARVLRDLDEALIALVVRYQAIERENARLRAALEHYADAASWERVPGRHDRRLLAGYQDGDAVARAALAEEAD